MDIRPVYRDIYIGHTTLWISLDFLILLNNYAIVSLIILGAPLTNPESYNHVIQRMLDLHKQTPATPFEQERLARDIASTDAEIDRLVYALYHLTPEEIAIVESS